MEFDWDDANVEHIARHGVTPDEVEEALLDRRGVPAPAYQLEDERRYGWTGATDAGRLLYVVYTVRHRLTRVITTRNANELERRSYRRRR